MAHLVETSYMRLSEIPQYIGRAVSRSALRREGSLARAEWELGFGEHRAYGEALREKAERNLRAARRVPETSSAS
jgi:hypothetical protein